MRTSAPRMAPLRREELNDEQREVLKGFEGRPLNNLLATLARDPKALRRLLPWALYLYSPRSLPERQHQIVILRTAYLCKSGYEFTQHSEPELRAGLSEADIARIKEGAHAGWQAADAALIRTADELIGDYDVSDDTWSALSAHFDEQQCMDVVFTVGQYAQLSMFLNTFGVQLEPGQTLDPDLMS